MTSFHMILKSSSYNAWLSISRIDTCGYFDTNEYEKLSDVSFRLFISGGVSK